MSAAEHDAEAERTMIAARCESLGFMIDSWGEADGRPRASLGHWKVAVEDESEGLFEGDEGTLFASVVGAARYHNLRVFFGLEVDGNDEVEVSDPLTMLVAV